MKKCKKALSIILCAALAIALLAGCNGSTPDDGSTGTSTSPSPSPGTSTSPSPSPSQSPPPPPPPIVEDEVVTLRFSWWGTDARHQATLAVIDAFMAIYPNIIIEAEYGPQAGYNDKKTTEFATGTAPDIFQIETGSGSEYWRMGVLYDISSLSSISFDKFEAAFLEANGQFGTGRQWCIPTGAAGTSLVVNKTLADAIGIDLSAQYSWEDLITMGQKVQAYDPTMYLISTNLTTGVAFFIRAYSRQLNGVAMIDDSAKKLVMTEEQFTEIFDYISRLYTSGTAAPMNLKVAYDNDDQSDPNWINGKYVASTGYTSSIQVLAEANNTGAVIIPGALPLLASRKSDGWTNNTPQFMGISADTPYPEHCALFFDFFFNSEVAAGILGTVRSIPPTAFAQQLVMERNIANQWVVDATAISLSYAGFDDGGLSTNDNVSMILRDAFEAVAYGAITPAAAARNVVNQINDYLATQ